MCARYCSFIGAANDFTSGWVGDVWKCGVKKFFIEPLWICTQQYDRLRFLTPYSTVVTQNAAPDL